MFTITDRQLAAIIGKPPRADGKIFWMPEDLPAVQIALRALLALDHHDSFHLISDTMPHWLHLALAGTLAGKKLSIEDLELGPAPIPALSIEPSGEGLTFRVAEEKDLTLVTYSIGRRITPADLLSVILPSVPSGKGIVIAGSGPPWMTTAIGLSYASVVPWVASTQKAGSAIVAFSKDTAMPAGSLIEAGKLAGAHQRTSLRTRVKRGYLWWFDYGGKPHPGLVVSNNETNERLDHVLIVPVTSTPWKTAKNLVSLPQAGAPGLTKDSYAVCEDLSSIKLQDLGNGPYATITDDTVIANVISQIRQVIGDITAT